MARRQQQACGIWVFAARRPGAKTGRVRWLLNVGWPKKRTASLFSSEESALKRARTIQRFLGKPKVRICRRAPPGSRKRFPAP